MKDTIYFSRLATTPVGFNCVISGTTSVPVGLGALACEWLGHYEPLFEFSWAHNY